MKSFRLLSDLRMLRLRDTRELREENQIRPEYATGEFNKDVINSVLKLQKATIIASTSCFAILRETESGLTLIES